MKTMRFLATSFLLAMTSLILKEAAAAPLPLGHPQQLPPTLSSNPFETLTPEQEACLREAWGDEAYVEQRPPTGEEAPVMTTCGVVAAPQPGGNAPPPPHQGNQGTIQVTPVDSQYAVAPGGLNGWFASGQEADILLSGVDFNATGGALLFNHPGEVASDGEHLLLADRNNNRVLIWNTLPDGNTPPDLVLGQPDFTANSPGVGADQMNWPVSVAAVGGKVIVADTYNDRVLIWNTFPTHNAQPADLILQTPPQGGGPAEIRWPWGVWSDGERLAVSSTQAGRVLLWNTFPTREGQPPDVVLTAQGRMGTPRGITANGEYLLVADHNARLNADAAAEGGNLGGGAATFVWKTWPTADQPPDFTLGGWLNGDFAPDGRLIIVSTTHYPPAIWDSPPADAQDTPDITLGQGYTFNTGDGSSAAWAGERLYLSLSNGNKIVGYNAPPAAPDQQPDFAIGAPDIHTNTLETHFIISNPVIATDGEGLFVSSDFDRKLYVWKALPDESAAPPDYVYALPEPPWDNALWGDTLVLAGASSAYIWETLPRNGELPDRTLNGEIGGVRLNNLKGVALDEQYFYLAEEGAGVIYVWEGIPSAEDPPRFTLPLEGVERLSSDGEYLAAVSLAGPGGNVVLFRVDALARGGDPVTLGGPGKFNLPGGVLVSQGHLFVADTGFNRVQIWTEVADALAGKPADVLLGARDFNDISPEIGRDKLFWPASLAFDGSYLWVGEFKFSERILRFSVH